MEGVFVNPGVVINPLRLFQLFSYHMYCLIYKVKIKTFEPLNN